MQRFFDGLRGLDDFLAGDAPLGAPAEKLFQGPISDALTHEGQPATLRRLAGAPVRGENYFQADVILGRVGPQQAAKRLEFDGEPGPDMIYPTRFIATVMLWVKSSSSPI